VLSVAEDATSKPGGERGGNAAPASQIAQVNDMPGSCQLDQTERVVGQSVEIPLPSKTTSDGLSWSKPAHSACSRRIGVEATCREAVPPRRSNRGADVAYARHRVGVVVLRPESMPQSTGGRGDVHGAVRTEADRVVAGVVRPPFQLAAGADELVR